MSTRVFQFSAPERHHPIETLETVQFGVSNDHGGLMGPEISQVKGWPSWRSGLPGEATYGRVAHHSASSQLAAGLTAFILGGNGSRSMNLINSRKVGTFLDELNFR